MDPRRDRAIGSLLGLAAGDALGVPMEFQERDQRPPVTDLIGGGPFHLKPGEWTDDTAMALCLAESLLAKHDFDPRDLMERFVRWWKKGENSSTGSCFDIGNATRAALERYRKSGDPFAGSEDPMQAGNGSIMRLAPVAIFWHGSPERAARAAREQSRTTHASPACLDACELLARVLVAAIGGAGKAALLQPARPGWLAEVTQIAAGRWRDKQRAQIRSSGYVVDTLEAAFWCVARSEDARAALIMAANLGHDADTVAAVTGQIAGSIWGASALPLAWREKLVAAERITSLAEQLFDAVK